MRNFIKIFIASFLAILVFAILMILSGVGLFNAAVETEVPVVKEKTVLVIDLSKPVMDQRMESGFSLPEGKMPEITGLYDLVRAIEYAGSDSMVKGLYILAKSNSLGFAASTELSNAILEFKKSGKFIVAASDIISQRAYEIAQFADDIYCSPAGGVDWQSYGMEMLFFKNAFDKLEIKPEIFYTGQFKGATEPYRLEKMSDANRLQLTTYLEDHYQRFLVQVSSNRDIDTGKLRLLAGELTVRTASDAIEYGFASGLKYDDEIRDYIAKRVGEKAIDKIHFMAAPEYVKTGRWKTKGGKSKISVIYAEGEIVDGMGMEGEIGGDKFRNLVRKARLDEGVKAIVLRVNSPGGSVMASEAIKREIELATKEKPVVVSMGDYAASGGYYIACLADSIFAQPNTLTGSIGVFSMFFDASSLMKNKLGITTDEVSTGPGAHLGSPFRPFTALERTFFQEQTDSIYGQFKLLVAKGRRLMVDSVDKLGQGRIWSGQRAVQTGLADRIGGMKDAMACAARMAGLKEYSIREYPEVKSFWEKLSDDDADTEMTAALLLKESVGQDYVQFWKYFNRLRSWSGKPQMRLPFFMLQ